MNTAAKHYKSDSFTIVGSSARANGKIVAMKTADEWSVAIRRRIAVRLLATQII